MTDKCEECGGTYGGHTRMCSKFPGYMPKKPPKPEISLACKKKHWFWRFLETLRAYSANEEPRF